MRAAGLARVLGLLTQAAVLGTLVALALLRWLVGGAEAAFHYQGF